jgi:hypothetical protein
MTMAGNPTTGSSLRAATVSRVMYRTRAGRPIRRSAPGGCADKPDNGVVVGKDADDLSSAFDPAVEAIACVELGPAIWRKAHIGEDVGGADVHAEHLAPAVRIDADRHDHGDEHDPVIAAHFHISRVEPDVGPVAFERPVEKAFIRASISSHRRDTWLLETPVPPIALTRSSTERVDTPWT